MRELSFPARKLAMDAVAAWWKLGDAPVDAQPVVVTRVNAGHALAGMAPGLIETGDGGWLGVIGATRRCVIILDPEGRSHRLPHRMVLREPPAQLVRESENLAGMCGLQGRRRQKLVDGLIAERLADRPACTAFRLRAAPEVRFSRLARRTGLVQEAALLLAAHVTALVLMIAAWWVAGERILSGQLDPGWLAAWAFALASIIPAKLASTWLAGKLSIGLGGLLKERLLAGAMKADADRMRRLGAGQLLGQVIETEIVEQLALTGGLATLLAIPELAAAMIVLSMGSAPVLEVTVLLLWLILTAAITAAFARRRERWSRWRLDITHRLVERMTGHRTRLAQQAPEDWHRQEDGETASLATLARSMDRFGAVLSPLMARGYPIAGLLALLPALMSAGTPGTRLAVTIGGILLGYHSLRRLSLGLSRLVAAYVSWRQMQPVFEASNRQSLAGLPDVRVLSSETVLDAQDLVYRHGGRQDPTLKGCNLRLRRGDFVLLEGSSGGGKSTLASVLAGMREPESGLILASGLDRQTLGDAGWRERIAAAPQYHENHIISAPLAFNLLMSRGWPLRPDDLAEATELCGELGLAPLIERMPSGLMTMVGETGWQLSQGERSRVFLARALLQRADVIVLDESFAALDPENLRQCLECVFRRAETLLVIAHP